MLEMTVTTKIVIGTAVVLLLGGYLYMRQHARELANKYKRIQRQKFKSKEPVIIEEIIAQLNGGLQKGRKHQEQNLQPSLAGNAGRGNDGKDIKLPLEPTTISTPVRLPNSKQSENHNKVLKNQCGQAQQLRPVNTVNWTSQNNKAPELPQTSIITKSQNVDLNHQNSLQERLSREMNSEVKPPIKPPPPNPTAKSTIEEIQLKELDLPKFVKETKGNSDYSSTNVNKESYPVRGQVKSSGIAQELIFQEDETLYTHINDYAKWVALQSSHFTLEYYENNTLTEIIPLIFNNEGLSRLNGHWFEMFRPFDLSNLLSELDKSNSTVYCSFSRTDIEHLCKPALQILAYVEFEASPRYEIVLEECALKEFVNFLQELKTMANQEN
jgi:hypothetical protein